MTKNWPSKLEKPLNQGFESCFSIPAGDMNFLSFGFSDWIEISLSRLSLGVVLFSFYIFSILKEIKELKQIKDKINR